MTDEMPFEGIKIISTPISKERAREIGNLWYEDLVKGVVDIEQSVIALGGEYHMDANMVLMENGSKQNNVWGFNINHDQTDNDWIEYISLINIRPTLGNYGMVVEHDSIKNKMLAIIKKLVV